MSSVTDSIDDAQPIPIEEHDDPLPIPADESDDLPTDDEVNKISTPDELLQNPRELPDGRIPLCIVAERGDSSLLKDLLGNGIEIDAKDKSGRTALLCAVQAANQELIRELSENRDKYTTGWDYGKTPIFSAIQQGYLMVVDELLRNKANVNAQDESGRTALSHAAQALNVEMITLLQGHNANIKSQDRDGRTAFSWVASLGSMLRDPNQLEGWPDFSYIWTALRTTEESRMMKVLKLLEAAEIADLNGRTPLSYAAEKGFVKMVKYICKTNAQEGTQAFKSDEQGRSALSFAAEASQQNGKVIQILLDTERFVEDSDHQRRAPLHWLHRINRHGAGADGYIKRGEADIRRLLRPSPQTNRSRETPKQPLYLLSPKEIELLDQSVLNGKTLLSYAVLERDIGLLKILCSDIPGIHSDTENDDDHKTALMTALEKGHSDIIKILVPKANIKKELQRVVKLGRPDLLGNLLSNSTEAKGMALESIIDRPDAPDDAVVALLEKALDVSSFLDEELDQELRSGRRPLEAARDRGSNGMRLVQVLLFHGANPGIWTRLDDWLGFFGHAEECLIKLSEKKQQSDTKASFGFGCETRETLEQTVPDDEQTIFFAHTSGDSWGKVPRFPTVSQYRMHEIEINFPTNGDIKTCTNNAIEKTPWGIRWIVKGRKDGPIPVIYESKLRKVWIPQGIKDFFEQFLREFDGKWEDYCHTTEVHLNGHRRRHSEIQSHIDGLEDDIYYLSDLRSGLQRQVRVIQEELVNAFDNSSDDLKDLQNLLSGHKMFYNERLDRYEQVVNSLLQLEYTRQSIREANTVTRISQFTFIYLPLMFASSLFGMNVDILRDNPGWYWYLLVAAVFLGITYTLYRKDNKRSTIGNAWEAPV
ncbi:ankyrin repeat-containing domain protein [Aspergillus carlsbadensis]|nr:ankyrin repeat-containing domain protein [Aspergillus carlsbadensis]